MECFCYENPVERIVVNIWQCHAGHDDFPADLQFMNPIVHKSPLHKLIRRKRQKKTPFLLQ